MENMELAFASSIRSGGYMGSIKNDDHSEYTIHELFAKKSFLKVKQAFEIGKVLFAFVEMNEATKKQTKTIDYYMDISDAALLAKKIVDGRIYRSIEAEKAKGEQYPQNIWSSPLGGINEQDAQKRRLRDDGKAISRSFSLAPGARQYAVFTATQQAAESNPQGLIVPIKDDDATIIRVAVGSYDELEKLALMLNAAVNSYMEFIMARDIRINAERRSVRNE